MEFTAIIVVLTQDGNVATFGETDLSNIFSSLFYGETLIKYLVRTASGNVFLFFKFFFSSVWRKYIFV